MIFKVTFSTKIFSKSLKICKSRPRKIRKTFQLYVSMVWKKYSNARSHQIEENDLKKLGFSRVTFFKKIILFEATKVSKLEKS